MGEVFSKKYKVLCKLGWGQYSTVWLSRNIISQKLYAIKIQRSSPEYMEAAKYELRIFNQVMRFMEMEKRRNLGQIVNVVELNDNFYLSGPNGVHMCFVYERLGGSILDLIKHYKYQGIPMEIVRPLAADVR